MRGMIGSNRPRGMNPSGGGSTGNADLAYSQFPTSGSYTVPFDGVMTVYGWGAGGNGGNTSDFAAGGGSAFKKTVKAKKGQIVSFVVAASQSGNAAGTTVTFPDGSTAFAGNGQSGAANNLGNGQGGTATGGDVNRRGGRGGLADQAGLAGESGGAGGAYINPYAGGGGAGGFSDDLLDERIQALGGDGGPGGLAPSEPGGGGGNGANAASGIGAKGRVIILLRG